MSRQELAEAVNAYLWDAYRRRENLSANDIGKLERGVTRWPGRHRREAFRAVLHAGTDAELGFFIVRGLTSPKSAPITSPGHPPPTPSAAPGDAGGHAASVVSGPAPAPPVVAEGEHAGAATHPPVDHDRLAYVAAYPRRVDRAAITALADMLDSQRRLEDSVGATPILPAVTAQLHTIARLVREAHGSLRPRLVDVAAQWAQFAGWLHLSTDQPQQATACFDRATAWAVEAGDTELLATITSFRGHGAWLAGQVGPLIGLTRAAMRDPTVYVGQRAYDAHQLARGHVLAGEPTAAVELLARGVDLVAETVAYTGPRPPWHYYRDQAFFDLEAGVVHALLGRVRPRHVDTAVNLLNRGLAALPDDTRLADWTGMYRYHLAVASVHAGARDRAEDELDQLLTVAAATGSARVRDYARSLSATLERRWGVTR